MYVCMYVCSIYVTKMLEGVLPRAGLAYHPGGGVTRNGQLESLLYLVIMAIILCYSLKAPFNHASCYTIRCHQRMGLS